MYRALFAVILLSSVVVWSEPAVAQDSSHPVAEALGSAEARFSASGLEPPGSVDIELSDDLDGCGADGWSLQPGSPPRLVVCGTFDAVDEEWATRIVARAWAETAVPVARQRAFVAHVDGGRMGDHRRAWAEWAADDAALVVAWGVLVGADPVFAGDDAGCAELRLGFYLLAGAEPVNTCAPTGAPEPAIQPPGVDDVVATAAARFAAAALQLPGVFDVVVDLSGRGCGGVGGRYHHDPRRPLIVVCDGLSGARGRRILDHELAHAWDHANLTLSDRAAILAGWELTEWFSGDEVWGRRAAEHVAEIVTWGVHDGPRRAPSIPFASCESLDAAFRFVTGVDPLPARPGWCERPGIDGPVLSPIGPR